MRTVPDFRKINVFLIGWRWYPHDFFNNGDKIIVENLGNICGVFMYFIIFL